MDRSDLRLLPEDADDSFVKTLCSGVCPMDIYILVQDNREYDNYLKSLLLFESSNGDKKWESIMRKSVATISQMDVISPGCVTRSKN